MFDDIRAISRNDPAARGIEWVLYPWLHALIFHRYIAHPLYRIRLFFFARLISQLARFCTGVEIHPWAHIGKGLFIDHGHGVVIGETAIIGENCVIFHNVTLWGTGKHRGKRHPTIWNNVLVGTNSLLLWPITVGDNVKIGAGTTVVMYDIPSGATVVGNPPKIVKLGTDKVEISLMKTKDPDW